MSSIASGKTLNTPAKKRQLGWDLWRFWGAFTIFFGHNLYALTNSNADISSEMIPSSFLRWMQSPDISWSLVYSAVPMFVFISGYFALGKPYGPNDWAKSKNTFFRYIGYVFRWAFVGLILFLLFPQVWPGMEPFAGLSIKEIGLQLYNGFINTIVGTKFLATTYNVNYFLVGIGWMILLSPLFKGLFHNGNIKAAHAIVLIITLFSVVFNCIRCIGGEIILANPDSTLGSVLSTFNPISTAQFTWFDFWEVYFLWGGLFATDKELQERVKHIPWLVVALLALVAYVVQNIIFYNWLWATSLYNQGAGIFLCIVYIMFAYKMNGILKEDSKLGHFIIKYTPDTLGVMTMHLMFGTQVMNSSLKPLFAQVAQAIWFPQAPLVTTFLWLAVNIVYFALIFTAVHWLKKIPLIGKLFDYPNIRMKKVEAT